MKAIFNARSVKLYPKVKTCKTCGVMHPKENFYADSRVTDGLKSECKKCLNARTIRNYELRVYGLNPEQAAVVRKPGACEVCGSTRRLSIDHDHVTGEVRGLLCSKCNTALGMVNDDVPTMLSLAEYVLRSGFRSFDCPRDPERDTKKADGKQRIDDTLIGQHGQP